MRRFSIILSVSTLSAFCSGMVLVLFFILSVSTLGIFFWDNFFMLHAHSLSVQDLRREAPASLEARFFILSVSTRSAFFSGIVFSCCMLSL